MLEIVAQPVFFFVIILVLMAMILTSFEVGMTLGLLALAWLFIAGFPPEMLAARFFSGISSFVLLAVPFFIFVGEVLTRAGMSDRILDFANTLAGKSRGALAHANVVGSIIFGGIQGAAMADVATLGTVFIPRMKKEGYPLPFSAAITATSSIVAPLIPPTIGAIILGAVANISIGGLLAGGIIPGLMIGTTDMIIVHIKSKRRNFPTGKVGRGIKDIIVSGVKAIPALIAPIIILFGIVFGFFTPSEAGAVAGVYSLFIGTVIYRNFGFRDLYESIVGTIEKSGMLFIIVGFASSLAWIFARLKLGSYLTNIILGVAHSPVWVLGVMCLLLLFIGTWLEGTATILLLSPLFAKVALAAGINPIHFGVVFFLMINVALLTPPLGVCLFVAQGVSGASFEKIVKEAAPFVILDLIVVILCIVFPQIVLFVPGLFGLT